MPGFARTCGPLFAEAEAGRNWLKGLTEVEPPASLVTNILASTTGVDTQRLRVTARAPSRTFRGGSACRPRSPDLLEPIWATVRQPRFAMSFGMAFFALSVGLTVAGVKPADLRIDQPAAGRDPAHVLQHAGPGGALLRKHPVRLRSGVARARNQAQRRARRSPRPAKPKDNKNDTTQQPEQKQERNYSQTDDQLILASAPLGPSPSVIDWSNSDPSNRICL